MSPLPGLLITGTDTGVGKTRLAACLIRALAREGRRVGALKPVATGCELVEGQLVSGDARELAEALGGGIPPDRIAPLRWREPLAPPVAARREGTPLSLAHVVAAALGGLAWWGERGAEVAVVEGVGGFLCPLAEGATVADLAIALDFPLLIVARRGLGTLNHTLLTVEAARHRGLRLAGIVLNGATPTVDPIAEATNADELARRLPDVPILAEIEHRSDQSALPAAPEGLDWSGRAAPPRWRAAAIPPERPGPGGPPCPAS